MPVVTKRPPARRSYGSERNHAAAGMLDTEKKKRLGHNPFEVRREVGDQLFLCVGESVQHVVYHV